MGAVTIPAAKLIALNVILLVFATTAVVFRIISKRIRQKAWQSHDYLCILSFLCLIGYTTDLITGVLHAGVGVHTAQLPLTKITATLKVFWASEFLWSTGVASFRLAIVFLYIDVFQRRDFYRIAVATAVVVFLYYVACILTVSLSCRPVNYNWNKTIDGHCSNTVAIEIFSAAFNMLLDIWVVCLPLPIVWHLQMAKQKKIGISATFALGLAIAGINLGRLVQTIQCNETDFTYCLLGSSMIVTGEMSTGILVACVPTLGPVFFPSRFGPSAKARHQFQDGRRAPLYNGSSGRNPLRGPASGESDERPFTTLEEDDVELKAAPKGGNSYQMHAGRASRNEKPDRQVDEDEIELRQELHVFQTPTRV